MTKTEGGSATTNGVRSSSAKPSTPRPESETPTTLDPKAPEFQPSPGPAYVSSLLKDLAINC